MTEHEKDLFLKFEQEIKTNVTLRNDISMLSELFGAIESRCGVDVFEFAISYYHELMLSNSILRCDDDLAMLCKVSNAISCSGEMLDKVNDVISDEIYEKLNDKSKRDFIDKSIDDIYRDYCDA